MPQATEQSLLKKWQGPLGRYSLLTLFAGILLMALLPSENLPQTQHLTDKWQHGLAFFSLTLMLGLHRPQWQGALLLLMMAGYGLLMEGLQGLSGYRLAEWGDLLADMLGTLAGLFVRFVIRKRYLL